MNTIPMSLLFGAITLSIMVPIYPYSGTKVDRASLPCHSSDFVPILSINHCHHPPRLVRRATMIDGGLGKAADDGFDVA